MPRRKTSRNKPLLKVDTSPMARPPLPVLGIAKTLPTVDVRLKDVAVAADSIAETMMD